MVCRILGSPSLRMSWKSWIRSSSSRRKRAFVGSRVLICTEGNAELKRALAASCIIRCMATLPLDGGLHTTGLPSYEYRTMFTRTKVINRLRLPASKELGFLVTLRSGSRSKVDYAQSGTHINKCTPINSAAIPPLPPSLSYSPRKAAASPPESRK